jgi:hypothetical protein
MSGNHNTKTNTYNGKWSINDEAIHRGVNYAEIWADNYKAWATRPDLRAMLKNAYQEGFLHGFEHKFDQHNYEEKKDG